MADYIYLLENRLSSPQRSALLIVQRLAAAQGMTVFLVGGAVRDLTSGSPVRDLDFALQGSALSLRGALEAEGVEITGVHQPLQSLYVLMPGGVRAEVGSTLSASYPKPAEPVFTPAPLGEDLRRRDFTANAMALSLNEGSYGLLIDPLNGVADIENRELRLVSNYGFIEEPVRLIRAARLMARTGWVLEEKTRARYETAVEEGYIDKLNDFLRGYELEEIVHEDEPLRVLQRLEEQGWMKSLYPAWSSSKVNAPELERLREAQLELQVQGIVADAGAAAFPLLTAKLSEKERTALQGLFPRQGFARRIEALDGQAKEFAAKLSEKSAAMPSAAWKLIHTAQPEAVLHASFTSRNVAVQARFKAFAAEWPQARQRIPYALLQEMRIGPELPEYDSLLESLFFALMDGELKTDEELRTFLEPYSPPAPPPVQVKRGRVGKKSAKSAGGKGKKNRAEAGSPEAEPDEAAQDSPEGELAGLEAREDSASDGADQGAEEIPALPEQDLDEATEPEVFEEPQPVVESPVRKAAKKVARQKEKPVAKTPANKVSPAVVKKAVSSKPVARPAKSAKSAKAQAKPVQAAATKTKTSKAVTKPALKAPAKPAAPAKAKQTKQATKASRVPKQVSKPTTARAAAKPAGRTAKAVKAVAKPATPKKTKGKAAAAPGKAKKTAARR